MREAGGTHRPLEFTSGGRRSSCVDRDKGDSHQYDERDNYGFHSYAGNSRETRDDRRPSAPEADRKSGMMCDESDKPLF